MRLLWLWCNVSENWDSSMLTVVLHHLLYERTVILETMKVDFCPDPPAPLPPALLFMMQLTHCSFSRRAQCCLGSIIYPQSRLYLSAFMVQSQMCQLWAGWGWGGPLSSQMLFSELCTGHIWTLASPVLAKRTKCPWVRKKKKLGLVGSKGTGFLTRCCLRDQRSQVFNATFHPAPLVRRDISEGFPKSFNNIFWSVDVEIIK